MHLSLPSFIPRQNKRCYMKPKANKKHGKLRHIKRWIKKKGKTGRQNKKHQSAKVHDPKSAKELVAKRLKDHPGQSLTQNVADKALLFCNACNNTVSMRSSSVEQHLNTKGHCKKLIIWKKQEAEKNKTSRKVVIENHFSVSEKGESVVGATLPEDVKEYRIQVLETFLRSMTPLHRVKLYKPLLSKSKLNVGDTQDLRTWIPLVQKLERNRVLEEVKGKVVFVLFDGVAVGSVYFFLDQLCL
jgi:hypothetical protein